MSKQTRTWLFNYLFDAEGCVPSQQILRAGREAGFSRSAIGRAREALNISVSRSNLIPSTTCWELTPESLSPTENANGRRLPQWARTEIAELRAKIRALEKELGALQK